MNTDKLLEYFAHVSNTSHNQTRQLFELCNNDFEKLMELEAKRKKHFVFFCPATKKEVEDILNTKHL